jgi:hypothetical protein
MLCQSIICYVTYNVVTGELLGRFRISAYRGIHYLSFVRSTDMPDTDIVYTLDYAAGTSYYIHMSLSSGKSADIRLGLEFHPVYWLLLLLLINPWKYTSFSLAFRRSVYLLSTPFSVS